MAQPNSPLPSGNDRYGRDDRSDEDEDELELEPIDPEILAHERRRAQEKTDQAFKKVDVDELLREHEDRDLVVDPNVFKQFRFTTRSLLLVTALLSVVMALHQAIGGCSTLFILGTVVVTSGWIWAALQDRRREAERQRRREAILTANPAMNSQEAKKPSLDEPPKQPLQIDLSFSVRQLMTAVTIAAVFLTLLRWMNAEIVALVMGLAALGGLVVNALGFDPPRQVVLGWWALLAVYLLFSLATAIF